MSFLDKTGLARLWANILALTDSKVSASRTINGKPLSDDITLSASDVGADVSGSSGAVQTNLDAHTSSTDIHMTSDEKTKLSGIETGAQKNTVTGVKGDSESSYRTGQINITKANIGLGSVDNTSDTNKPVSTAQQTAIDGALSSAKSYTDTKTSGLASTSSVNESISNHNASDDAHNNIRVLITDLTTKVNNFLDVDDATTDQLSEVLTLINNNKGTLESLTTSKINVSDIVDNLTTSNASKVLSAKQGVALKALIDALQTAVDGKAASSHNHAASEITSGTLSSDRLPTVPLTKGGTGATSAAAARTNLEVYSTTEVDTKLSGKANSSHGNHVPATETANNAKFLRNDNTWQTVTPANIGAASSTHSHAISDVTNLQSSLDAKVPTTRTINGKALTSNITLSASDVSAYTKSEVDNLTLITVDDIDTICGATIQYVSLSEGAF